MQNKKNKIKKNNEPLFKLLRTKTWHRCKFEGQMLDFQQSVFVWLWKVGLILMTKN